MDLVIQVLRRHPVTQLSLVSLSWFRDRLDLVRSRDDCFRFNSGNVPGVSPGQEAVLVLGQRDQDTLLDQVLVELGALLGAAVHDVEGVGLAEADLGLGPSSDSFRQGEPVAVNHLDGRSLLADGQPREQRVEAEMF